VVALKGSIEIEQFVLAALPQMHGVCMIYTAMYGNGSKTGRATIPREVLQIQQDLHPDHSVCVVVVLGNRMPGYAVQRFASMHSQTSVKIIVALDLLEPISFSKDYPQ
jgi:hypothetical protein